MRKGEGSRARRPDPCREIREAVHHLLDGRLSPSRKEHLRRHLAVCPPCFSRIEFARIMRRLVKERVCREGCPGHLIKKVRAALWAPRRFQRA